ncbi:MAG: hypothetical protein HYY03_00565 [Chloroflexi bacterium]|nr:hypothetical protein [Chloroflexota bacterium]
MNSMYACPVEELVWAVARERQEEARQTQPHTEDRPQPESRVRSWLGRPAAGDRCC